MNSSQTVLLSVHNVPVRQRIRALLAGYKTVELVADCSSGAQTLLGLRDHQPAVALLDAQMPDLGAFDIVAELGSDAMPSVVFLTSFDSAILRVLEVHALNYVLLPLDEARFHTTFARALRQTEGRSLAGVRRRLARMLAADEEGSKARRIPVRNAGKTHFVDLDDINWVEGAGTFARLHLVDRTHVVKATLDQLGQRFADDFVRIHSILVRTSEIAEIETTEEGESVVKLRDGQHIHVRRSDRAQLLPSSDRAGPG